MSLANVPLQGSISGYGHRCCICWLHPSDRQQTGVSCVVSSVYGLAGGAPWLCWMANGVKTAGCKQPSLAAKAGCLHKTSVVDQSVDRLASAGETLLEEAVLMSAKVGLVRANDHIVCVQRIHEAYVVKIVSVNDKGTGIEDIRPKSLIDMMKVRLEEIMQTGQATFVRDKGGQDATFVQDRVARTRWWSTSSVDGCSLLGWAGPCCAGAGPSSAEVPANCLTGSQNCLGAQAGRRAWSSSDSIY